MIPENKPMNQHSRRSNSFEKHANHYTNGNMKKAHGNEEDAEQQKMNSSYQCAHNHIAKNWVSFIEMKVESMKASQQYFQEAEKAGADECAALFRKAYENDVSLLSEAKQHLACMLKNTEKAELEKAGAHV